MRRSIVLVVAAMVLGGCTLARGLTSTTCPSSRRLLPQAAADYVDFVQVDGITYHARTRGATGRELHDSDLGAQVSVVRCKLADHIIEEPGGQLDGDAAYLDPGTAVYAVRGYRPSFRLAARREGKPVLFEAAENPRAGTWGELLDLGGKVRRITVHDDSLHQLAVLGDRRQVNQLVGLLLRSPLGPTGPCPDRANVALTFSLEDGTATSRAYDPPSRRLDCHSPLPRAFGATIDAALP
jgi:hypothetical protein